ncbi:putative injection protein [Rhizobium phage RHph_N3_2]|nr:putative injection protein [Rhizobium phage RHph_N3_2]
MALFPTLGNKVAPWFAGNDTPYNNSNTLLGVGLGLLSGKNAQEQVGNAASNFANERQMGRTYNKTLEFLKQNNPDLAQAVENGALDPASAYKLYYQQKLEAQKPKNNYLTVGKNLYNLDNGQWISPPAGMGGNDDNYFGTVVKGYDAQGNPVYLQPGKDGSVNQLKLPEGFKPENKFDKVDLGDSWMIKDNTNGSSQIVPKNLANAESQKEIGTAQGKAIAAAPGDLQAGLNAKDLITQLRVDPNRERGTGWSSIGNIIPGTSGYDYQNKVDQAKSGAFLTAIQQMRGLGSLSNAEGGAATAAVTRMNTATSEEAFNAALDDYEKIIDQGIARAQAKIQQSGGQVQAPPGIRTPGATSSGVKWSIEP